MKICGCPRSISYSAVVPHLACPTMKKSGVRVVLVGGALAGALHDAAITSPPADVRAADSRQRAARHAGSDLRGRAVVLVVLL